VALNASTYLVDKSAFARARQSAVATALNPLFASGRIGTCGVLELEVLFSARNHADFVRTRARLAGFIHFDVVQGDFDRALEVMELLARRGQHRAAGLSDLVLAAVAERHGATLLHYDADFDLIAAVTGQPAEWVVPRGSVP
jgi:predicted nucleic acid-binding protein